MEEFIKEKLVGSDDVEAIIDAGVYSDFEVPKLDFRNYCDIAMGIFLWYDRVALHDIKLREHYEGLVVRFNCGPIIYYLYLNIFCQVTHVAFEEDGQVWWKFGEGYSIRGIIKRITTPFYNATVL